jgi:hypothetical protein
MASEWYYRANDETLGPLSSRQLRSLAQSGTVEQDTFVWKQGLAKWVAARRIKGLMTAIVSKPVCEQPSPPTPPPATDSTPADIPSLDDIQVKSRPRMRLTTALCKKPVILCSSTVGVIALLLAVFFLMPDRKRSAEALGEAVFAAVQSGDKGNLERLWLAKDETLFQALKDQHLDEATNHSDRKKARADFSEDKVKLLTQKWYCDISDSLDASRDAAAWDWTDASLVAVIHNQGERAPESEFKSIGAIDNTTLFVIFELRRSDGRDSGLYILAVDEVVEFRDNWSLVEDGLRVTALTDLASSYLEKRFRYAFDNYSGPERSRIVEALREETDDDA